VGTTVRHSGEWPKNEPLSAVANASHIKELSVLLYTFYIIMSNSDGDTVKYG